MVGVAVVGVLLWAASFPGWPLAAGIIVSVLVLGGLLLILGNEPAPGAHWLRPVGLVVALVLAVGGAVVIETSDDAVLQARFESNRASFEQTVQGAGPLPGEAAEQWLPYPGECPGRIGSYAIAACHAFEGGFVFLQERGGLGGDAGFAYAPDGPPAGGDEKEALPGDGFTPIDGPWYAWSCGC